MNALVIFSLLVAAVVAAPVKEAKEEPCETPSVLQYSGLPLQLAGLPYAGLPVQYGDLAHYAVPAPIETRVHYAETPVVTGYTSQILKPAIGQAVAGPLLAQPVPVRDAPLELVEYQAAPAINPFAHFAAPVPVQAIEAPKEIVQVQQAVPAITSYAHFAPLTYQAPVQAQVHYAETPVVTGYTSQILKPAIGQALATPFLAGPAPLELNRDLEINHLSGTPIAFPGAYSNIASPLAYSNLVASPLAYSNINLDVPAPIPAGDAPAWEELVSQEKILAPARAVSKITPQITNVVPEVKIEKVAIDVPVAQPYAHPVPVPVHTPVATPVLAPIAQYAAYQPSLLTIPSPQLVKADC